MNPVAVVWLAIGLGVPALLAICLVLFPVQVISLQGRFYRRYYIHFLRLSTDEIDRGFQLPTDRLLMGKRSEFLQHAEEDPSRFRVLILLYRSIGILIGILLLCAIGLLWLGFATGTILVNHNFLADASTLCSIDLWRTS